MLESFILYWIIVIPFMVVFFSYRSRIMDIYPKIRTSIRKDILNRLYAQFVITTTAILVILIASIFTLQSIPLYATLYLTACVIIETVIMDRLYKLQYRVPKIVMPSLKKIIYINYSLILFYPLLVIVF